VNLLAAFGAAAALAVRSVHLHAATRHLAERDALTGVLNRRGFAESVEREFRRARRFGRPRAVLLLVIDHFKRITEWHGNSVGDAVLMQVAGRCRKHLRADDVVGRRGPAEFAVLLVEASGEGAHFVAERLRGAQESVAITTEVGPIVVTASIGLAALDRSCPDAATLIRRAEEAVEKARKAGRNRVEVWVG
jgi:diguanylate cyclase (GGDEF)-like protein